MSSDEESNGVESIDSESAFDRHFIEGNEFEFTVDLDPATFQIERVLSGKKHRDKVKTGWSTRLNEIVWNEFKSDCSWSFKRADVVSKEVVVNGKCSSKLCAAVISVQTSNNLSKAKISIEDFDGNVKHEGKKRRIAGDKKSEIGNKLKNSSAFKVRNEIVKESMVPGDVEPAHLPTLNALRIQKHRNRMKDRPADPYQSLAEMAEQEFRKTIHFIGFNPFSVIYSTPLQRKWYRTQTTGGRRVISIDATGIKPIPPKGSRVSDKKSAKSSEPKYKSIFLYVIMSHGAVPVPVGVMLSQDHTMRFNVFWLNSWAFNNPFPDEIFLDQSAAQFGACVQAFTNSKNTNAYISECFNSLLNETPTPPVFLRIDRYHFVCTIHRIKEFKKMDPLKVSLLKAVFGALMLCDNLQAVKKIVTDLFTILRNRLMTEQCEYSLIDLQRVCETHEIFIEQRAENEEEEGEEVDDPRGYNIIDGHENDSYKDTSTYRLVFKFIYISA